jgi:hypothetical protein
MSEFINALAQRSGLGREFLGHAGAFLGLSGGGLNYAIHLADGFVHLFDPLGLFV